MSIDSTTIPGGVLVLAAFCNLCSAQGVAHDNPLAKLTLGTRGISTTFVKWQEIESRDSDGRGHHPFPANLAAHNLSKYDAIWCAMFVPAYNRPAWRILRSERPNILTLYYMSSNTSRIRGSGSFDYEYINAHHPEWFLLRDATDPERADPRIPDNRARRAWKDRSSPDYNRFYLDVCNLDFQKWAAERIVDRVSGKRQGLAIPYHGFAADNVNIGRKAQQRIAKGAPNWAYADRPDEWNAGFCRYLKTVKEALNKRGFVLVANHSMEYGSDVDAKCWDLFVDCIDGVMTERAIAYGYRLYKDEAWLSSIRKHERIIEKGLIDWWVCYPPASEPEGHERFLYNYCSWLLVKQPGRSLFFATRGDRGYRTNPRVPWYEEYDLPMGEPRSPRYRKDACWAREYSNALVVVNPTREIQTVRFERHSDWVDQYSLQLASDLTMPPTSGRILMPDLGRTGRN